MNHALLQTAAVPTESNNKEQDVRWIFSVYVCSYGNRLQPKFNGILIVMRSD